MVGTEEAFHRTWEHNYKLPIAPGVLDVGRGPGTKLIFGFAYIILIEFRGHGHE